MAAISGCPFTEEELPHYKRRFAEFWARNENKNAMEIGYIVCPRATPNAMAKAWYCAEFFTSDMEVLNMRDEYLIAGPTMEQSKDILEARYWSVINNPNSKPMELEKIGRALAELKGWVKGGDVAPPPSDNSRTFIFTAFPDDFKPDTSN